MLNNYFLFIIFLFLLFYSIACINVKIALNFHKRVKKNVVSRAFSVPHSARGELRRQSAVYAEVIRKWYQRDASFRGDETLQRGFSLLLRDISRRNMYTRGDDFSGERVRERRGASEGLRGVTRNVTRFGRHNYVSRPGRGRISRHVDTYETHNIGGGEGGKKPKRRNERRNSRDARGNIELPPPSRRNIASRVMHERASDSRCVNSR